MFSDVAILAGHPVFLPSLARPLSVLRTLSAPSNDQEEPKRSTRSSAATAGWHTDAHVRRERSMATPRSRRAHDAVSPPAATACDTPRRHVIDSTYSTGNPSFARTLWRR